MRVNCKSSLDRTNLFQTKIGMLILDLAYQKITGQGFESIVKCQSLYLTDRVCTQLPFLQNYKNIWGHQGNQISRFYAGTDSLTDYITMNSNAFVGKIKSTFSSIQRLWKGTFADYIRHYTYQLILGTHLESQDQLNFMQQVEEKLKSQGSEFTQDKKLSVYMVTWNF